MQRLENLKQARVVEARIELGKGFLVPSGEGGDFVSPAHLQHESNSSSICSLHFGHVHMRACEILRLGGGRQ